MPKITIDNQMLKDKKTKTICHWLLHSIHSILNYQCIYRKNKGFKKIKSRRKYFLGCSFSLVCSCSFKQRRAHVWNTSSVKNKNKNKLIINMRIGRQFLLLLEKRRQIKYWQILFYWIGFVKLEWVIVSWTKFHLFT